jgi:hypothetical protein
MYGQMYVFKEWLLSCTYVDILLNEKQGQNDRLRLHRQNSVQIMPQNECYCKPNDRSREKSLLVICMHICVHYMYVNVMYVCMHVCMHPCKDATVYPSSNKTPQASLATVLVMLTASA